MISVKNLTVAFGEKTVFSNLSVDLRRDVPTLLVGPSGSGKTTLLRAILGLQKPTSGKVIVPIGMKMAVAFQEPRLFRTQNAREQLMAVGATQARADALLAAAGLFDAAAQYPRTLSGGMQHRVSVLRALAAEREAILLDEPLAGLDAKTATEMVRLILKESAGKILVISTHHPEMFADVKTQTFSL